MHHELKTWPIYFDRVWEGKKGFEVRKNDRDFQAGDTVTLREFEPGNTDMNSGREMIIGSGENDGSYTGRKIECVIDYVLHTFKGLQAGWCVFTINTTQFITPSHEHVFGPQDENGHRTCEICGVIDGVKMKYQSRETNQQ